MSQLTLKVLSNSGVLLNEQVDMVVVPGLGGDIGIEPSERTFVYLLKAGIVYLFKSGKVSQRYFILNGKIKAEDNLLIINTDLDFINLDKLNKNEINIKINTYKQLDATEKDVFIKDYYNHKVNTYKSILDSEYTNYYK